MSTDEHDPDRPLAEPVTAYLQGRLEERWHEVERILARGGSDWEKLTNDSRHFAKAVMAGIDGVGWFDEIDPLLEAMDKYETTRHIDETSAVSNIASHALLHVIAENMIDRVNIAEARLAWLLRQIKTSALVSQEPLTGGNRTTIFLKSVSRCFLNGFDAECIVMCRAAIESEIRALLKTPDDDDTFNLCDAVKRLCTNDTFKTSAEPSATIVREAGNRTIHRQRKPNDVANIIMHTIKVIQVVGSLRK